MNCKNCKAKGCFLAGINHEMSFECGRYIGKSNADKIRSMTDEELAEFFQNTTFCDSCFIFKNGCGTEEYSCEQRWLDWLKQEEKDD